MSREPLKWVHCVVPFGITPGTAGFSRVIGLARSFERAGVRVTLAWLDEREQGGTDVTREGGIELVRMRMGRGSGALLRVLNRAFFARARDCRIAPRHPFDRAVGVAADKCR